jgi:hypothetical protein
MRFQYIMALSYYFIILRKMSKGDIYDQFHNWPRGFRTKLAHFWFGESQDRLRCVLCWSYTLVHIHHYRSEGGEMYPLHEDNLTYSKLENFVPLCGSCHGKVERCEDFYHYGEQRPPFLRALHAVVKSKTNITPQQRITSSLK